VNSTQVSGPVQDSAAGLARHLADIARLLLLPGTIAQTLQRIVGLSVASIEGCDESGLCEGILDNGDLAPSSPLIAELDRRQTSFGEGPCIDALGGLDSVYVNDLTDDGRWPRFGPLAAQAGLRSVLAYRLFAGDETLGALQLYARLPAAFNATDRAQGLIFAAHAGMALGVARAQATERGRTDHLQTALISREIIGQAQGILMERERITAEQAFDLLRRSSQHLNRRLRDVAQELIDTGNDPTGTTVAGHDLGSSERDDVALIEAIAGGDHHAFVELHGRYLSRCVGVARHVLAQDDGVADVIQSVFLDVWRRAARYDPALGSVATWLLALTHHRAVDYIRREDRHRSRRSPADRLSNQASAEVDPAGEVLRAAEQQRVAAALATLTLKQREVLVLSYYGGHTQRQIADLLDTPLGTVKSRARDGLRHLREQLTSA